MTENLLQPKFNTKAMKAGSNMMFKFWKLGEFLDVYVDHDLPNRKCGRSKTGKNIRETERSLESLNLSPKNFHE